MSELQVKRINSTSGNHQGDVQLSLLLHPPFSFLLTVDSESIQRPKRGIVSLLSALSMDPIRVAIYGEERCSVHAFLMRGLVWIGLVLLEVYRLDNSTRRWFLACMEIYLRDVGSRVKR